MTPFVMSDRAALTSPSRRTTSALDERRFVFVAGLHRSGTTLLARLLAVHPEISGFSDTGVPADEGQHLQNVYPRDYEYGRPGRFGFAPEMHLTECSPLVSQESAQTLFAEWSPHWDLSRPLLLEKSPPNLIKTRFLQALYPESAFVIVIRHPIPVSIPTAKWRGTRRYDRLFEHWLRCHALFEADRKQLRRVHVLTYEELVRDPTGVLRRVFEFLEVEPIPANEPIETGANDKYFRQWKQLKHDPRMRAYLDLVSLRYERRMRRYGYSLLRPRDRTEGNGMSAGEYRTEYLMRGNLDLRRDAETGNWRLAWSPHYGEPDWPGQCYSPGDRDLPGDYPAADDPDALVKWGRRHFGP